jgi:hypothetical protein
MAEFAHGRLARRVCVVALAVVFTGSACGGTAVSGSGRSDHPSQPKRPVQVLVALLRGVGLHVNVYKQSGVVVLDNIGYERQEGALIVRPLPGVSVTGLAVKSGYHEPLACLTAPGTILATSTLGLRILYTPQFMPQETGHIDFTCQNATHSFATPLFAALAGARKSLGIQVEEH